MKRFLLLLICSYNLSAEQSFLFLDDVANAFIKAKDAGKLTPFTRECLSADIAMRQANNTLEEKDWKAPYVFEHFAYNVNRKDRAQELIRTVLKQIPKAIQQDIFTSWFNRINVLLKPEPKPEPKKTHGVCCARIEE